MPHLYQVTETYELSGVDYKPVTVTRYLTFVQRGGKWLLASGRDGAPPACGPTPRSGTRARSRWCTAPARWSSGSAVSSA